LELNDLQRADVKRRSQALEQLPVRNQQLSSVVNTLQHNDMQQ